MPDDHAPQVGDYVRVAIDPPDGDIVAYAGKLVHADAYGLVLEFRDSPHPRRRAIRASQIVEVTQIDESDLPPPPIPFEEYAAFMNRRYELEEDFIENYYATPEQLAAAQALYDLYGSYPGVVRHGEGR